MWSPPAVTELAPVNAPAGTGIVVVVVVLVVLVDVVLVVVVLVVVLVGVVPVGTQLTDATASDTTAIVQRRFRDPRRFRDDPMKDPLLFRGSYLLMGRATTGSERRGSQARGRPISSILDQHRVLGPDSVQPEDPLWQVRRCADAELTGAQAPATTRT